MRNDTWRYFRDIQYIISFVTLCYNQIFFSLKAFRGYLSLVLTEGEDEAEITVLFTSLADIHDVLVMATSKCSYLLHLINESSTIVDSHYTQHGFLVKNILIPLRIEHHRIMLYIC